METTKLLVKNFSSEPGTVILFNSGLHGWLVNDKASKDVLISAPNYTGGYAALIKKAREEGITIAQEVYCSKKGYAMIVRTYDGGSKSEGVRIHMVPIGKDNERKVCNIRDGVIKIDAQASIILGPLLPGEEVEVDITLDAKPKEVDLTKNNTPHSLIIENNGSKTRSFALFGDMKNYTAENQGNHKDIAVRYDGSLFVPFSYTDLFGAALSQPLKIKVVYCSRPGKFAVIKAGKVVQLIHAEAYPNVGEHDCNLTIDESTTIAPDGWELQPSEKIELDLETYPYVSNSSKMTLTQASV